MPRKQVVIPESTPTCALLWDTALRDQGESLKVFPGIFDIPRGIQASLEEGPEFAEGRHPDKVTVLLTNGMTVNVPADDVVIIAKQEA